MDRYTCPSCNEKAFPCWRKLAISPMWGSKCRKCGEKVRVGRIVSFLMLSIGQIIPLLVALIFVGIIGGESFAATFIVGYIIGVIPQLYIYCLIVPILPMAPNKSLKNGTPESGAP